MSMLLMVQAMKTKVGNPLRKLVLIKLADNASDEGECWPSYQYIADQCEISKRSVMNHIDALCEAGLVRKEYRSGPKGNSSNLYILTLDGAGDSLGGGAGDSLPGAGDSLGGGAGAAPRTSHSSEPVKEPVKRAPAQLDLAGFPEQPSAEVWADYLKHRKAKRAPISQTVINTLAKELTMAAAAGWSVDDALAEAMAAGWQGLKASWLINRAAGAGRPGVMSKQAQIEARNRQAAEDFVNGGVR